MKGVGGLSTGRWECLQGGEGGGIDDEDMQGFNNDTSAACFSYIVAYYRLWNDVIRSNMGAPEKLLNDMSCLPLEPSSQANMAVVTASKQF